MPVWIQQIEIGIRELAAIIPLELFVVIGAFAEEVIAPIPSMLVMTTAGYFAHLEGRTTFFLIWLVLLGNLGKLAGSFIYYTVGDKIEDVLVGRFGRYLGLKHADIERIGQRFNGSPWRDGALIFLLRVIPFFPTIFVSVSAGVVRIRLRVFLTASYLGNFCKDLFYAFAGYSGARALRAFFMDVERVRFGVGVLLVLAVIASLVFLYIHRHHGLHLYRRFRRWLRSETSQD
ncbi:MAG: VTT domain-containing protein [Candidatus Moraniibacteriota bacterium]